MKLEIDLKSLTVLATGGGALSVISAIWGVSSVEGAIRLAFTIMLTWITGAILLGMKHAFTPANTPDPPTLLFCTSMALIAGTIFAIQLLWWDFQRRDDDAFFRILRVTATCFVLWFAGLVALIVTHIPNQSPPPPPPPSSSYSSSERIKPQSMVATTATPQPHPLPTPIHVSL